MNKKKETKPAKRLRSFLLFLLCTALASIGLLMAFSTKPIASAEDIRYINAFLKDWNISATPAEVHQGFENEIAFIGVVQDNIVAGMRHQGVDPTKFGNVRSYYQDRQGMCYDRVVLLEKILQTFHFDFRHVFVYYLENDKEATIWDFFRTGTGSHALTEVKTSKGWMVIGSNADWMGIDVNGYLFTIRELKEKLYKTGRVPLKEQPLHGVNFWEQHPRFRYIYGVYSRHGHFLSPYNTVPDYNFRMLLYNL
jgi:hypothetical protein